MQQCDQQRAAQQLDHKEDQQRRSDQLAALGERGTLGGSGALLDPDAAAVDCEHLFADVVLIPVDECFLGVPPPMQIVFIVLLIDRIVHKIFDDINMIAFRQARHLLSHFSFLSFNYNKIEFRNRAIFVNRL